MVLKGNALMIGEAASDVEIHNLFDKIREIDDTVVLGKTSKVELKNCQRLHDYKKAHMRERRYMNQVKKCDNAPLTMRLKRECLHVSQVDIIFIKVFI